tara:strand:+ start:260 stop:526 length:267 start_codon:yes stop_codon:yes gene_type:complete
MFKNIKLFSHLLIGGLMAKKVKDTRKVFIGWQAVPLKGSFMLTAMLGFFLSIYFVYPISSNFGLASMFVFALMFIASLLSLSKAPIKE